MNNYRFRLRTGDLKDVEVMVDEEKTIDDIRNDVAQAFGLEETISPTWLVFILNGQLLNRKSVLSEVALLKMNSESVINVFVKPFAEPMDVTNGDGQDDEN